MSSAYIEQYKYLLLVAATATATATATAVPSVAAINQLKIYSYPFISAGAQWGEDLGAIDYA